jgi:type IV pilus assembly protein PilN
MIKATVKVMNLASQPFRKERAQNATYAAVCAALLCSLLVLVGMVLHERAAAADIRKQIEAERTELEALTRQQGQFATVLAKPQNADVFSTNVFLNELIARRSVSWTRVFEDLKTVVPHNMRVEVIRLPQLGAQETGGVNHVQLDMVVGTDRPDAVVELLKHLESSSLFGAASVVNQTPPTQNDPLYKYRVMVSYAQKL